ncbi:DUF3515 domain-containing protein [Actinoplanes sp. NPDC023714]|uniref:DUF3515 domain-containing protein n=1 Tax=Actinoplanes sp. NPDC023714 TaxID=3154322 RepID=UPI0033FF7604
MVNLDTPKEAPKKDPATRAAALWATAIAVPVAVLVGVFAFIAIQPEKSETSDKPVAIPSSPVQVEERRLDEKAGTVCLAVTSQLPAKIRDLPARPVTAGHEQNAAYGEPPITVSCGVPAPVMCETLDDKTPGCVPMDTELLIMNRVCWYAKTGADAATITTMDREVPVQVTVPNTYENAGQWANEFSDTVVKTVKSKPAAEMPSGCQIS